MQKRPGYKQNTNYDPVRFESYDEIDIPRQAGGQPSQSRQQRGEAISFSIRKAHLAAGVFLIVSAIFCGLMIASYFTKSEENGNLPVIIADTSETKEIPSEEQIAGAGDAVSGSTVYGIMNDDPLQDKKVIENLLEPQTPPEQPVNMKAAAAPEAMPTPMPETSAAPAAPIDITETPVTPSEIKMTGAAVPQKPDVPVIGAAEKTTETATAAVTVEDGAPSDDLLQAATQKAPDMQPAGTSPETLAFVRSVLDKKDAAGQPAKPATAAVSPVEAAAPAVEPSAGMAVTPGTSYIQLGSVKDRAGAAAEWGKLQKSYGALSGLQYRVEEANLGDKGVFYRIQAGPVSKDSAKSICDSIKAQKPGGCLIVK